MNSPSLIFKKFVNTVSISLILFDKAKECYNRDEFDAALGFLDSAFSNKCVSGGIGIEAGLALYGRCLLAIKDYPKLEKWKCFVSMQAEETQCCPLIEAVVLEHLLSTDNNSEVEQRCAIYLEKHRTNFPTEFPIYLFLRGYSRFRLGNVSAAIDDCENAYSFFRVLDDQLESAKTANVLGIIHNAAADYREAQKWYRRSLGTYSKLDLSRKESMVYLNIGITLYKSADYGQALESLLRSLDLGKQGGWVHRQCFANIALGNVYRLLSDFSVARRHLHRAYNQAQKSHAPRQESLSLEFLGDVYRDEGKYAAARRFYGRAMTIARSIAPEGDIVMELHRRIGECNNNEGLQTKALMELETALTLSRAQGDRYEEGVILRVTAETYFNKKDLVNARICIEKSAQILETIGARHEHAVSLMKSAEFGTYSLQGTGPVEARTLLDASWNQATQALDILLKVDVAWWTQQARQLVEKISTLRANWSKQQEKGGNAKSLGYIPEQVIIHQSTRMTDILTICDIYAKTDEPILVLGETGTGKELVTNRIHKNSHRCNDEFVAVNVAAIPPTLFEREFFGHVKGSFSGANSDSPGYAGLANGGTLFLDEIGDLPLEVQPKLLRLLQEGTYLSIGDPKERKTNIRLLAATNTNLDQLVADGKFRADLYYRLKILEVEIPPVRNRREDILPLMRHFLSLVADRRVEIGEYFNNQSIDFITQYDWPGNVREVAMIARRAHVFLTSRGRVDVPIKIDESNIVHLSGPGEYQAEMACGGVDINGGLSGSINCMPIEVPGSGAASVTTRQRPSEIERARIISALDFCDGNRQAAAKYLGLGRSTLYRRMEKLGINYKR